MDELPGDLATDEKLRLIQQAADVAAEGIVITDTSLPDNPIIYANKGFERLTGYSREYIFGKNCRFLQGEETDPRAVETIRQGLRTEEGCTVELVNYRKNGEKFWNRLSITPLRDASGRVTHYVGVQSDITELKTTQDKLEEANRELRKFHTDMTEELQRAQQVQQYLLPDHLPVSDVLKIACKFDPLADIGGDFYDVVHLPDGKYGMLVADVTGHGVPAALLCFMSLTTFRSASRNNLSTAAVLNHTNEMLLDAMPEGTFVTMFYAIYDPVNHELIYTQAGHPAGMLIRQQEEAIFPLATHGRPIGLFNQHMVNLEEKRLQLSAGDKVLLYTDAITEAGGIDGALLDVEHLGTYLENHIHTPIDQLIESLYTYGLEFSHVNDYSDDVTLIGLEVLA